jgi:hypothetical protein
MWRLGRDDLEIEARLVEGRHRVVLLGVDRQANEPAGAGVEGAHQDLALFEGGRALVIDEGHAPRRAVDVAEHDGWLDLLGQAELGDLVAALEPEVVQERRAPVVVGIDGRRDDVEVVELQVWVMVAHLVLGGMRRALHRVELLTPRSGKSDVGRCAADDDVGTGLGLADASRAFHERREDEAGESGHS